MKRMYELSSEEVVQLCTALEFYIHNYEQAENVLRNTKGILSDEEVQLYNKCVEEIEAAKQMYNKFRIN